ncbi:MAG: copper resistance CopC/CopD family protein [Gaiellaceae bacterium]
MKTWLAVPAVALAVLAAPAAALAHANLVRSDPGNGAVLARPPAIVTVAFDDTVRAGPGIAAIRNGGASILAGRARIVHGRTLVIPLRRGLSNGDYSVRWAIVSNDGHLESGVLAFAVGLGRPPPLAGLAPAATGPTAGSVLERLRFFTGILGAVGIALFALLAGPLDDDRIPLVLSTAAVLAAVGAAEEVHRVGLGTRDGRVLGAGFVAALFVATAAGAATLERRALRPALVLALGLAVVPSLAGHALDPGLARVNVVVDVLHVAAAAAWVGALVGLVAVRDANVRRASLLAFGGVAVLGASGVFRAGFELTAFSQLWSSSYGRVLLVKTALLLAGIGAGWLLRAGVRRRARVELALVATLVVAVSVLVQLRPGRNAPALALASVQALEPTPPPPAPPRDAVVLAQEAGALAVALAAEPRRATVFVLSPAGGGLDGLDVSVDGTPAARCGHGCYAAPFVRRRSVVVAVSGFGAPARVFFTLPVTTPSAAALVRRAHAAYRELRSVAYREHLASDPAHAIDALWRLEKPNRLTYSIAGGARAIVVGARRWDSDGAGKPYVESSQTPLPQPATQWSESANAHVLARSASTVTVSFVDPTIPAYFTVVFDRATLRPRVLRMAASAHFMTDRYLEFNEPPAIRPPR